MSKAFDTRREMSIKHPIKCITKVMCDGNLIIHDLDFRKCDKCGSIFHSVELTDYYDGVWEREHEWVRCEDCEGEFMRKDMKHFPRCNECELVRMEESLRRGA